MDHFTALGIPVSPPGLLCDINWSLVSAHVTLLYKYHRHVPSLGEINMTEHIVTTLTVDSGAELSLPLSLPLKATVHIHIECTF